MNTKLTAKCGECLHYKQHAHLNKQSVCDKLGVKHYTNAPPRCYTPDVSKLVPDSEALAQIALMFGALTSAQRRLLVFLLSTPRRKLKMEIGTKVYWRAVGGNYLSNYVSGYVLGATSTGQIIVAGSPEQRTRGAMYMAYFDNQDDLYTHSEFIKVRADLERKGNLVDPKKPLDKKIVIDDDYTPPTLDSAPREWKEAAAKKTTTRRPAKPVSTINIRG